MTSTLTLFKLLPPVRMFSPPCISVIFDGYLVLGDACTYSLRGGGCTYCVNSWASPPASNDHLKLAEWWRSEEARLWEIESVNEWSSTNGSMGWFAVHDIIQSLPGQTALWACTYVYIYIFIPLVLFRRTNQIGFFVFNICSPFYYPTTYPFINQKCWQLRGGLPLFQGRNGKWYQKKNTGFVHFSNEDECLFRVPVTQSDMSISSKLRSWFPINIMQTLSGVHPEAIGQSAFGMVFIYGRNDVNSVSYHKYRYLFTYWWILDHTVYPRQ